MDKNNRLPKYTYKHFWEIDPSKLDVSQYSHYVIVRILEYGDIPELRWLFSRFSEAEIVKALKHTRNLSIYSANFWAKIFQIPNSKVKCLNKRFQMTQNRIWQR